MAQQDASPPVEVLVSVADQKMVLLCDGCIVSKYRISTSKFGVGDSFGSYKTPLGKMRVCEKIGESLDPGTVIKNRSATGEILKVNAPGRDPIVTRILWLEGLENQNRNARTRGIYIHGTPEERTLGEPKSWGCIRMRSSDVMELFERIPTGTPVNIIAEHLPRLEKYKPAPPAPPVLIAENTQSHAPLPKSAPVPAMKEPPKPVSQPETEYIKSTPLPPATVMLSRVESAPAPGGQEQPVSRSKIVLNAMMGSILSAGLPTAPRYVASTVALHSASEGSPDAKTANKP